MDRKNLISNVIFILLCVTAVYYIGWGQSGMGKFLQLKYKIRQEHQKITDIETDIKDLKQKIHALNSDSFEIEKIARQDLNLGYTNELVYVLPKN